MADLDSYLLKCTLESLDEGIPSDEVLSVCERKLCLSEPTTISDTQPEN